MGNYTTYKLFEKFLIESEYMFTNEDNVVKSLNFVKREFESWCEEREGLNKPEE